MSCLPYHFHIKPINRQCLCNEEIFCLPNHGINNITSLLSLCLIREEEEEEEKIAVPTMLSTIHRHCLVGVSLFYISTIANSVPLDHLSRSPLGPPPSHYRHHHLTVPYEHEQIALFTGPRRAHHRRSVSNSYPQLIFRM